MPDLTAPSPAEDHYDALLACVQARFTAQIGRTKQGPVHLFRVEMPGLYARYLEALPAGLRQEQTCSACRRFVERYGGVVRVEASGERSSLLWAPEAAPAEYRPAIAALAEAVAEAPIVGVYLAREARWGAAAGAWTHLSVAAPESLVFRPSGLRSAGQVAAERREDHAMLLRGLAEFSPALVDQAHILLKSGTLYRSEVCVEIAAWLKDLHGRRAAAANERARDDLTWLAVAAAPPGYCHVRSTMIGGLLEDLAAELPIAEIVQRFSARLHPLQYQRPTAPPSAGNIAMAEKIVAQLRSAGALERRFARLADIQALWRPKQRGGKPGRRGMEPTVTITWEKFARTVLPSARSIEYYVPREQQYYLALVTAKHAGAPPILQWDSAEHRNPVSWYLYTSGSAPERWNLKPETYHPVTAVTLQPSMWRNPEHFAHQGKRVIFVLEGARDLDYAGGAGLFPVHLKAEYREIRATIEAYWKEAKIEGRDHAEACGIGLQSGASPPIELRVTGSGKVRVVYQLDRWD